MLNAIKEYFRFLFVSKLKLGPFRTKEEAQKIVDIINHE